MQTDLHLKLLGCPQILRAGTPVEGFISSKVPALLYYLAVTNRAQSRDVLGTLFWGDLPQNQARKNLRDALSNLRKLLDPYILVNGSEIAFNSQAPYRLDIEAFEVELPAALQTGDLTALNKIGDIYQGDFLEGFFVKKAPAFEEWVQKKREHFHRLAGETFKSLVEINLARGDILAALSSNNKWLALEPWNEEAHRSKITLLLKNGQRSAALAQYAACQRVLLEELGTEPDPLTQTLIKRLDAASRPVPLCG
jgi:DNA-binding SARP family transcriptional activator